MRPVRLMLEGFTSFRNPQEVDFSQLDLFVITGATGSGKTSILDAVTLALYGNVPRTNKHELKELISLGASQAKVQLDFEVDRTLYRVARKLPRSGAQVATVERLEDGETIPEVDGRGVREANARIEEIVGLDYDAFTRAVLLPQGAFADFLKGDASQRRNILIRLLDLDRFIRAGKLAGERARGLGHEVTAGEEVLAREYEGIDEGAVEEARAKAAMAEKAAGAVERANQQGKERWKDREVIRRRVEALEEISKKLTGHACELDDLKELWGELREKDAETTTDLEQARKARKVAEKKQREAELTLTEVTEEVGDDAVLAELAETAKSLAESEEKIVETSAALEKTEEERQERQEERGKLAARLKTAQAAEKEAKEVLEQAVAAVTSASESLDRSRRRASLGEQLAQEREREAALRIELDQADQAEETATKALEQAAQLLDALETEHQAAAIRSHLQAGDDCPVCGSEIAELPEKVASTVTELETARAQRTAADRKLREAGKKASGLQSAVEGTAGNVQRTEKALEEFAGEPVPSAAEDALRTSENRAREARMSFEAAGRDAQEALSKLTEHDQALAVLDARLSEGRAYLAETQGRAKRCRSRLVEVLGEPLPEGYAEEISDRQARLKEAASTLKTAAAALGDARLAFEEASSNRAEFDRDLQDFDGRTRTQRSLLEERGEALGRFPDEEAPAPPLGEAVSRPDTLGALAEYREALQERATGAKASGEQEIDEVDSGLVDLLADAGVEHADADLATALEVLDQKAGEARLKAERSKDVVKDLRERLDRRKEMTEALAKKRSQMRLYEKVAGELRRNRFISFLLDESFQDLALRASSELQKISDGRYSLAATGDSFLVVDHANADERRSVVTLSGGETFLASLALALALAQGITDIAGHSAAARLESMFIDEGFGTLDPTALDLSVEALERLREGERMVGVITHVAALAQRIPAGIVVEQSASGSVVQVR